MWSSKYIKEQRRAGELIQCRNVSDIIDALTCVGEIVHVVKISIELPFDLTHVDFDLFETMDRRHITTSGLNCNKHDESTTEAEQR